MKKYIIIGVIVLIMLLVTTQKGKAFPVIVSRIRSSDFNQYIYNASTRFHVPVEVISSIIARESSGWANIKDGGVGEIGLMQIRPDMALVDVNRIYKMSYTAEDLRNSEINITVGTAYLAYLEHYFFPGKWNTVIRAYNCGMKWARINPLASLGYLRDVQAYMELFTA